MRKQELDCLTGGEMFEDESKRGPKPLYGERMTSHVMVPLPADLNEQLIKAAAKLHRTKADLARTAIEDFLSFLKQN